MIDRKWIGHTFAPYTRKTEASQLWFFAKAIGETNPIYTDEKAAKAGYKDVFAHGMLGMAYLGQVLTNWIHPSAIQLF